MGPYSGAEEARLVSDLEHAGNVLAKYDYFGGDEEFDRVMADCFDVDYSSSVCLDPKKATEWKVLEGTAHFLRFERDSQNEDIIMAEQMFEQLAASPHVGASMRVRVLYGLGRVHEALRDRSGSLDSLERAYEYYRNASDKTAETHDIPPCLIDELTVHLADRLSNLAHVGHAKGNVAEALDLLSNVLPRTEDASPIKPHILAVLATIYMTRWWIGDRKSSDDLTKADELIRDALLLAPSHRHRPRFLFILARICLNIETLESTREAIHLAEQAMGSIRTLPPTRAVDKAVLNLLALAHANIYEMEGRLEDLDSAVKYLRVLTLDATNALPGHLVNLCLYLTERFDATGRLVDIDEAVSAGHRVLQKNPTGRDLDYSRLYIGHAYLARFVSGGEHDDFEAAHGYLERGLKDNATPNLQSYFFSYLARLYSIKFNASSQLVDLDQAIVYGRQGTNLARTRRIDEAPSVFSWHGAHLARRFELTQDRSDLLESIQSQERALELASPSYHDRHFLLGRYGRALQLRFESDRGLQDSQKCEEVLLEALHITSPARLPQQSIYLAELGDLSTARYKCKLIQSDLDAALDYYTRSSQTAEGFTCDRFQASVVGGRLAQENGRLEVATTLFATAVSCLPKIAWLGMNASTRHARLVQTATQIACDAAASAVSAGQPERAVELLDEGRSIVWRSMIDLRADLQDLEKAAPELARELAEIGQGLEHNDAGDQVSERVAEERATRRRRTAERWEELVTLVRSLDGFEGFLRPLPFGMLNRAANEGPVVLLNISQYGSHALILESDEPVRTIQLKGLDFATVLRLAYDLGRALRIARDLSGRSTLERVLLDTARRLWTGGLDQIAAALSDRQLQFASRPRRVWWIPTGFMSLLPVHCAGPYAYGQQGIPDLFISSYSTTLSALLLAREGNGSPKQREESSARMLAIGTVETPGMAPLPSTYEELQTLSESNAFPKSLSYLYGPDATVQAVTAALPNYNWIHACCHGHLDTERPLNSAFKLINGSLTVSYVAQMRLRNADFAFLSACHTARHATHLPDESTHLAAALQVAGFRGVIGTAWAMVDRDGPDLARRFYHWLSANGRQPDAKNAAEALHLASKDLRKMGLPLYRWAAFVHIGV